MEEECLFCSIIKGEVPGDVFMESPNFVIVKDVDQRIKGHSMVMPKKHVENFMELEKDFYEEFLELARAGAEFLSDEEGSMGFNLITNNGEIAGQVVPHLHLHILPRKEGDGLKVLE